MVGAPALVAHTVSRLRGTVADARRALGYARPPEFVVLFLTDRCNLRCSMCAQYGEAGINVGRQLQEMPLELVCSIVDQVECFKPILIFMGGEPMFHRQWGDALAYARARGLRVRMITNGTLLRKNLDTVLDGGLDWLTVSVDGTQEAHDAIRGKGTFRVIREALVGLREAKRERKVAHPSVTVACTISERTHPHLVALADQLAEEDWGVDEFNIQHLSWLLPEQLKDHNAEQMALFGIEALNMDGLVSHPGEIDVERLVRDLETVRGKRYPFVVRWSPDYPLQEIRDYYGDWEGYARRTPQKCEFIWRGTTVYPSGYLTPCMNFAPGNLREQPFLEIWNGPEYRRFRRVLQRRGRMPVCHRCCN